MSSTFVRTPLTWISDGPTPALRRIGRVGLAMVAILVAWLVYRHHQPVKRWATTPHSTSGDGQHLARVAPQAGEVGAAVGGRGTLDGGAMFGALGNGDRFDA